MGRTEACQLIIKLVGGQKNINKVWHCMTRLRFDLIDDSQVDWEKIKALPGVLGAQNQSDQVQIIIGPKVNAWYQDIVDNLEPEENKPSTAPKARKSLISLFMDTVSGVFGPIVPAIAGAGMIKGLLAGLIALKIISAKSDTVMIIDLIASGVFYFLPFFLAVSAAKIFKTNEYLAAAVAACLMYPTLIDAAKALAAHTPGAVNVIYFMDIVPVSVFNYSASVIPVIFSILALSYIHRWVDKIMPDVLKTVFTPTLTLFITALVSLTLIGPAGIYLGKLLAFCIQGLFDISSVFAGFIVGAIRPVAILTGMHHAMTPIALQNFTDKGFDMLMPMMFMANMAIAGSTFAIYFHVKTREERTVVLSAAVSGLLGITEPALFGVLTKYKKAFIATTISSSIASAFIAFFGVRLYGYILSSIFSLPAYIGPYFIYILLGVTLALGLSFTLTYLLVVRSEKKLVAVES
ncbi:PTS system cellobiose/arbutin/salicin-specific transporter subunit IIBC [Yersinia frederiksenii]|uniref:PTS transporter subunit EIIC n=1 Tax=Yersinia alsatica TaxID=2890317 RepID=A0ABY5ULS6_9GAMM|nr:PTS transporter subunit EIIC [Yersinia alsatica]CNC25553.1 PTS system cellobiose/arbutin/salicin-specific transporter subunit IIBC [Yersinia frederiksenii]UWM43894.1 PTS transporter subunit EIIC [Yersinia alsatica]CNH74039.1 PTS system cellobiose/arbutin/salicin-specific transporter subunit IIBC [Yersinia frederiksenii]CNH89802.1 PTS system cellobiose/arbutin/salicin-specific transporter subunit IIBC [Yersinia frederiksenii]CNK44461.1 PTS system cellobiose/arbutin/salicin-specific transport